MREKNILNNQILFLEWLPLEKTVLDSVLNQFLILPI